MTNQHPITPPSHLLKLWKDQFYSSNKGFIEFLIEAAQWGADQELEACCEYLVRCAQWEPEDVAELRATRRPKPPSLKEMALAVLDHTPKGWGLAEVDLDTIRRALESMPD